MSSSPSLAYVSVRRDPSQRGLSNRRYSSKRASNFHCGCDGRPYHALVGSGGSVRRCSHCVGSAAEASGRRHGHLVDEHRLRYVVPSSRPLASTSARTDPQARCITTRHPIPLPRLLQLRLLPLPERASLRASRRTRSRATHASLLRTSPFWVLLWRRACWGAAASLGAQDARRTPRALHSRDYTSDWSTEASWTSQYSPRTIYIQCYSRPLQAPSTDSSHCFLLTDLMFNWLASHLCYDRRLANSWTWITSASKFVNVLRLRSATRSCSGSCCRRAPAKYASSYSFTRPLARVPVIFDNIGVQYSYSIMYEYVLYSIHTRIDQGRVGFDTEFKLPLQRMWLYSSVKYCIRTVL